MAITTIPVDVNPLALTINSLPLVIKLKRVIKIPEHPK
jgi:hypothetical protein